MGGLGGGKKENPRRASPREGLGSGVGADGLGQGRLGSQGRRGCVVPGVADDGAGVWVTRIALWTTRKGVNSRTNAHATRLVRGATLHAADLGDGDRGRA